MADDQLSATPSTLQTVVQTELEANKASFQTLLASLSDDDLQRKSVASAWTIKETLVHIVSGLSQTPGLVKTVRTGRGIREVPMFLYNWLNLWLIRLAARGQTRQSIQARYEQAHQAVILLVAGIQPDEWSKGAVFSGPTRSEFQSIETIIRSNRAHLEEHVEEIDRSLTRP